MDFEIRSSNLINSYLVNLIALSHLLSRGDPLAHRALLSLGYPAAAGGAFAPQLRLWVVGGLFAELVLVRIVGFRRSRLLFLLRLGRRLTLQSTIWEAVTLVACLSLGRPAAAVGALVLGLLAGVVSRCVAMAVV